MSISGQIPRIGPLADMPEFYQTFGVKEGDAMWRTGEPESEDLVAWNSATRRVSV